MGLTFLKSTCVQNSSNSFTGNSKTSRAALISSSVKGRVRGSISTGFSSYTGSFPFFGGGFLEFFSSSALIASS